jgi:hypothetical protein
VRFSRILAVVLGLFLPIAETVRRWSTWQEFPLTLIEDYVLGALFLAAAWLPGRDFQRGQSFLAAVWGIGCGIGYGSFVGQLQQLQRGEIDPAPIPSWGVAAIKGVMLTLGVAALVMTVMARPPASARDRSGRGGLP